MKLTIRQALKQDIAAHREDMAQETERLYRSIIQSQPTHPDANHNLGVIAVSVGKTEAALPLFKSALESNPKTERFWLSYIDALITEKQFEAAKQFIKQGRNQGVSTDRLNSLKEQLGSINQKDHDPNFNPSQQQLSNLLEHFQAGRYGDAEQLALSLTQKFPNHPFSLKVLGEALNQTGRKAEALGAKQKAVQLAPHDHEVYNNSGITLKDLDRLEEAETKCRQAVILKPDFALAQNS